MIKPCSACGAPWESHKPPLTGKCAEARDAAMALEIRAIQTRIIENPAPAEPECIRRERERLFNEAMSV
jgi:hypothetical protein